MCKDELSILPLEIKKHGYILTQIMKSQYAAAYAVTDEKTGANHGYEVFEVRIQQPRTLPNGVHFAHKEQYPSDTSFGVWAFAPRTRRRAFEIFAAIEIRCMKRKPVESHELA